MSSLITVLATDIPIAVPDSGATGYLLGLALLATGLVARFIKNRKP
jgi:hypothetical protein